MKRHLVKIKVSKFAQFYVTNKEELNIIKQLNHYKEGGCCGQSRCFVCEMGGCKFKYQDHIEITNENEDLLHFIDEASCYDLLSIIEMTEEQDDYDDQKEFKNLLIQMVKDKKITNIVTLCTEFYFDANYENLDTLVHHRFFSNMIQHLSYTEYTDILKVMKRKMDRKLLRR
jgi:hypothetical protein